MKSRYFILIVFCLLIRVATAEQLVNELPMYGEKTLPEDIQEINQKLIDWAIQEYKDLNLASKDVAQRGWKAYYKGDFKTAMKRFNQAWLFDKDNPEAYWGFGILVGQHASKEDPETNLKNSIRFLEIAEKKAPDNGRIIGDLAFSHTILAYYYTSIGRNKKEAAVHFDVANKLFPVAYKADPEYPPIVANWSVFYFYTGDYQNAKKKADEAEKMGYEFSSAYIKDLKKMRK